MQELKFIRTERDRFDHADVWLDLLVEEGPLLGASLHRERERRESSRPRVDLGAVEVVGEDQSRDLGRGVALLLVDGVEQVEGVGEHVA